MSLRNLFQALAVIAVSASALTSCSGLKAPPATVSSFLKAKPALKADRETSPFALSGGSPVTTRKSIYIAQVTLNYLRPATKSLAKEQGGESGRRKAAQDLATYARERFVEAFKKSPKPRYTVEDDPDEAGIKLELAVTELNRNTFTGAVSRFAMNAIALPGTDAMLAKPTRNLKGNIAIEGKVTDIDTGKVIYQFADNEESKSALLLPVKDFEAYGQARDAIREWAEQFEEVTRTPPGQPVKASGVISLF